MASDSKTRYPLIDLPAGAANWDWTDNAATWGIQMALIHNVFIRHLNSIYYHAPLVRKGDEQAFVGYCLAFTELIHDHHNGEETIIFPFLQEKFDMKVNVDQHAKFTTFLEALDVYLAEVQTEKQTYDGNKIRELVEAFGDILVEHLHDEIPTLSPERLSTYDKKDLDSMIAKEMDHIKAGPLTTSFVVVATHHDYSTAPTWPPQPKPVEWIIRNVAYWRHPSYWKFSPFTRQSKPQAYC
ncbi:hypothetical protein CPB83DRAFT_850540 [Crepidotus variabilis]|uniref:Hemerythrin-like domain-containing protein n=1 Tax=Crepidotus variabilis TaxID=179855 RepID=A0A9P6EK36_9AGAR|nr:hypothetical protein CPB83DRAFT_850540 [Crepidotus variabilis]